MKKIVSANEDLRLRNPFRDALVTELLEDVDLYRDMFSDSILVGQACNVFQPGNTVVLGPLGCGKSMILNLTRLRVLAHLSLSKDTWPKFLTEEVPPFFGISINLTRASFYTFGRRSISEAMNRNHDPLLDTSAAADFLSHFLFAEFIKGIKILKNKNFEQLRQWFGFSNKIFEGDTIPKQIAKWPCWKGYYAGCKDWNALKIKCQLRLETWRRFLNTDIDEIPKNIWTLKAQPDQTLHSIGNLVRRLSGNRKSTSLFVYIDQYEVLIELNRSHGTELQRLVNTLIKSRDPVVFYKIGARTYDWGQELRVTGAESCIEVQRDYTIVNLTDVLVRTEDRRGYLYPDFAIDVACRRLKTLHGLECTAKDFKEVFGKWNAFEEAKLYFSKKENLQKTIQKIPGRIKNEIIRICGKHASPLELRLASAWALQKLQRNQDEVSICERLKDKPWLENKWWLKERKEIGLVQIASHSNQQRRYYGWDTICYLSGGNITVFLMICSEIWDVSARQGIHLLANSPLDPRIQSEGVLKTSDKWRERDRNEVRGGHRYNVVNRIGMAISKSIRGDLALSNPGHTGFSLSEDELYREIEINYKVRKFLEDAVSWTIIEERRHRSKNEKDSTRRKYYLHPILSPHYQIPIKRVKEPFYTKISQVYSWIFLGDYVDFSTAKKVFSSKK